jgi:hypothetical protein
MNTSEIKEFLRPWIRVETWHSTHPSDQQRFHQALNQCFQQIGHAIDIDSFKEAIHGLANELHPNLNEEYLEKVIDRCADNAETISDYLNDIGTFRR